MTPLEHFREAERWVGLARDASLQSVADWRVQVAQVHATLATCHMTAGVWGQVELPPGDEQCRACRHTATDHTSQAPHLCQMVDDNQRCACKGWWR